MPLFDFERLPDSPIHITFSEAGAELLFEIVSRAYERFSLIVTTNLPFEQWSSELLTGAMLDGLTPPGPHHQGQWREFSPQRCPETETKKKGG